MPKTLTLGALRSATADLPGHYQIVVEDRSSPHSVPLPCQYYGTAYGPSPDNPDEPGTVYLAISLPVGDPAEEHA